MVNQTSASEPRSPSRARYLLLVPLAVLVLGLIAAFAWWQYFKTTPAYSLALLVDAAKRNDKAALDRLVDTDQVIKNFMAGLHEKAGTGYSGSILDALRDRLRPFAPETSPAVKERIREGIQRRINELGESSGNAPFVVVALGLYFNARINVAGDKATVLVNRKYQNLELVMTRTNDLWRVTSAKDDALATQIIADTIKDVPKGLSPVDLPTLPRLPIP